MHFRFRIPFSRYFKNEPEILADIPFRIDQNENIPILLLIKDSDKHPLYLDRIEISILKNDSIIYKNEIEFNLIISQLWWFKTIYIPRGNMNNNVDITVEYYYKINGKNCNCINHNLNLLSPTPLKVYLSEGSYPKCSTVQWVDLHYHSNFTEDMVEFGAPLESVLNTAKSMGIHSIACTDHSYDLDDKIGSWVEADPQLEKWEILLKDVSKLNNERKFAPFIIQGEELSLHNAKKRNVHLLVLNNKVFLSGQGDSAEIPFNFKSEYNSKTLKNKLELNSLCIAAHPLAPVPFKQWLLVKRGKWEIEDLTKDYIVGMQILNGSIDIGFRRGMQKWTSLLLLGYKKYIYAGNDAHGNFNIFRQISTPMLSLKEKDEQVFGECRTGYFPNEKHNVDSAIETLRNGNCFITNGPYLKINFISNDQIFPMGSEVIAEKGILEIISKSSEEFGKITKLLIFKGIIGNRSEMLIYKKAPNTLNFQNNISIEINDYSYLRAEIESVNYRGQRVALTNPIWIKPK
ncbi:MAG: hypothetical protein ISR90_02990 [Candidatus Marinimicrobia bacterium]|nr:hypothetical protein [Candidatus Neomarinimicrobiota bacterium]MBL7023006.1 hypothetical protein [Candidatus Neomarinimicrobiota bacterium]